MRQLKFALALFLFASISASPGCMASLGSRKADQERAEDYGATIGGVASVHPAAPAVGAVLAPIGDLATREGNRIADARDAAGEPIGLWASVLLSLGAGIAALTRQRRQTAHIDELYDATKELAVKTAAVPKPPGT